MKSAESQSLSTLLKKYNLRPRKGLGQNFLTDSFHLAKIVEAAGLTNEDTVLEIGPGPGTLTRLLVEAVNRVIAVELDSNMVNLLKNELGHLKKLTIVEADILQTEIETLITSPSMEPTPPATGWGTRWWLIATLSPFSPMRRQGPIASRLACTC